MFAAEPPSSSNPTKRLCWRFSSLLEALRRPLLQIGGANITGAERPMQPLPSSLVRSARIAAGIPRTSSSLDQRGEIDSGRIFGSAQEDEELPVASGAAQPARNRRYAVPVEVRAGIDHAR
jgi:hypothetical protein